MSQWKSDDELDDWDREDPDEGDQDDDDETSTGACPECGAEVYEDADQCPICGTWIDGVRSSQERLGNRSPWWRIAVGLLLLGPLAIVLLRLMAVLGE